MDNQVEKSKLFKTAFVFMVILCVFFAVKTLAEFSNYRSGDTKEPSTITLSGHGEVTAVPDIATISFTISKDAKTVKEAQALVAEVEKKALEFLRENNIADKDIKTNNASFYPKYDWRRGVCSTALYSNEGVSFPCPAGENVLVGYTASESINVKVREVDNAGAITTGLGALKVTDLNGPNFSIDEEDTLNREARKEAIADAKAKAEVLARDLGVRLVKIVNFSESGYYPMPMYAKAGAMNQTMMEDSVRLELPKGENIITSDVSIVYEIR